MAIKKVLAPHKNQRLPVKIWTEDIDYQSEAQLSRIANMPFVHSHVAAMPDVHLGKGATVGSVIATEKAIIPAAVGVDIGCGMNAIRLSLNARDLPDNLRDIRFDIEKAIPLGPGGAHSAAQISGAHSIAGRLDEILTLTPKLLKRVKNDKAAKQLGTLGSGNHFIELCLDENEDVWVMLHSGSRGIGNIIGTHFIELAKRDMERWMIHLPDRDLAYFVEGSDHYGVYLNAVKWAQDYAFLNRAKMMEKSLAVLRRHLPEFSITQEAINCHHNYVEFENHFGKNVHVTRKGAIRARVDDLGIIPGSMGAKSYIVRGKGNKDSFCSCSHGAGRRLSRTAASKQYTVEDMIRSTEGVECRKDAGVIDEIPMAYKDIDQVMENQNDLVEVVHTLRQVINIKG
ncbi:MAG: RNA-splicing ligase RtcB [Cellvibrionaceae bacterium]|nr:RNA-splicing ligase RtcB [Cellvibrionaceae bacterium]|tara:strand:- start:13068 stop:14264 length:1197 start_codon:yes stop_codon:yes gene_type:complete